MKTEIYPIALGIDTCYVLKGDGVVVLDAGQPNKVNTFRGGLARAGIEASDVGLLLLTHAHWDHMGSAAELREVTGAPLAVHQDEVDWVQEGNPPLPSGFTPWAKFFLGGLRVFAPLIKVPATKVDIRLSAAGCSLSEYGVAGRVLHTPGHSPGSVSVVLETGEAFVGDLAMNRFPLTLRPSLSILGDDFNVVVASWRKLLQEGVRTVFPAHGKPFPVDLIRRALDRL